MSLLRDTICPLKLNFLPTLVPGSRSLLEFSPLKICERLSLTESYGENRITTVTTFFHSAISLNSCKNNGRSPLPKLDYRGARYPIGREASRVFGKKPIAGER